MKKGYLFCKKRTIIRGITRVMAMFLAFLLLFSGNGMTVFAREIGGLLETLAEELGNEEGEVASEYYSSEGPTEADSKDEFADVAESVEEGTVKATLPVIVREGSYNDMHWSIDSDGKLLITQHGERVFYREYIRSWDEYWDMIRSIEIDANCFIQVGDEVRLAFDFSEICRDDTWSQDVCIDNISFGENFDSSGVTDMSNLFVSDAAIFNIDFTNFDTDNVWNMRNMFGFENGMEVLDLSAFDMSNVTQGFNIPYTTKICTPKNLKIDIPLDADYTWIKEGTEEEYVQLPKNLENSIVLVRKETQEPETEDEVKEPEGVVGGTYESLVWEIEDKCLTITQETEEEKKIENLHRFSENAPWNEYVESVERIHLDTNFFCYRDEWIEDEEYSDLKSCPISFYSFSHLKEVTFGDRFKSAGYQSFAEMFSECRNLESVDFSGIDTSSLINMNYMFAHCEKITAIDLSDFETKSVIDMSNLFYGCRNLTEIDMSGFDTRNVINMSGMFTRCENLTTIDLSIFNTGNVEKMSGMFKDCYELQEIDVSSLDTSKLKHAIYMFWDCKKLKTVDLSQWDWSSMENNSFMFQDCTSLESVKFGDINAPNLYEMLGIVQGCENLEEVTFGEMYLPEVQKMSYMFKGCKSLEYVDLRAFSLDNDITVLDFFKDCDSLCRIEMTEALRNTEIALPITDYNQRWYRTDRWMEISCIPDEDVSGTVVLERYDEPLDTTITLVYDELLIDLNESWEMGRIIRPVTEDIDFIEFVWTSSNPDVVSVDEYGYITGKKVGSAVITVSIGGEEDTEVECAVTVEDLIDSGEWGNARWTVDKEYNVVITHGTYWEQAYNSNEYQYWLKYGDNIKSLYLDGTFLEKIDDETILSVTTVSESEDYPGTYVQNFSRLEKISFSKRFKTHKITDMSKMFSMCSDITELDLSRFDTSNVTSMREMFAGCSSITELDLSSFDTSNVKDMSAMFMDCSALCKIEAPLNLTITNVELPCSNDTQKWYRLDTGAEVTNLPTGLEKSVTLVRTEQNNITALTLNRDAIVIDIDATYQLDTILVPETENAYINWASSAPGVVSVDSNGKISGHSVGTAVITANVVGSETIKAECRVTVTDLAAHGNWGESVYWTLDSNGVLTITQDNGIEYEYFEEEVPWKQYIKDVREIVWDANCLRKVDGEVRPAIDFGEEEWDDEKEATSNEYRNLTKITFTDKASMKYITDMSNMFFGCVNVTELDISGFDMSAVTDMSYMFYSCVSLQKLNAGGLDTSSVKNMSATFFSCRNLTEVNMSGWDTSNVTNMSQMFAGCKSLMELVLTGFETSKVTDISFMFYECESLINLDVSKFKTDNITTMSQTFYGCSSLTELDVSGFNTSNVTTFLGTFQGCSNLKSLDVSGFDTQNVTDVYAMFSNCSSITSLDVSGFDTGKVTGFSSMFYGCSSLTSLDVSGFNTGKATGFSSMFYGCSSLTSLDVGGFDTSNAIYLSSMFHGCSSLTNLDVSGFCTGKVKHMWSMFEGCSSLQSIDVSGFNTENVTQLGGMFTGCSSLKELDLSSFSLPKLHEIIIEGDYDEEEYEYRYENEQYQMERDKKAMKTLFKDCVSLTKIKMPRNLYMEDVILPVESDMQEWYRVDTGEDVTCLLPNLTESAEVQRRLIIVQIDVTAIELNKSEMLLNTGDTCSLTATIKPADATIKEVEWTSLDESIATVNQEGLVTACKPGTVTISVKALGGKDVSAECKVTVVQFATTVKASLDKDVNDRGEYVLFLEDTVAPVISWENGEAWPEVDYSVSNDTAEYAEGKLTAKKGGAGVLAIMGKNGEKTGPSVSINYRVCTEKVSGITLNESNVILDAQSDKNYVVLKAEIANSDKAYAKIKYSVDKADMVRIEEHGNNEATVTLIDGKTGIVEVTATAMDGSGQSAKCTIVCGTLVESITVSAALDMDENGKYLLSEGKSVRFTAGILPSKVTQKAIKWVSSDETVIRVDQKGNVTALKGGEAMVYAAATDGSGVTGTATIRVIRPAAKLSLNLTGGSSGKVAFRNPDEESQFEVKATLTGADGKTDGVLQDVDYAISGKGAKNVLYLGDGCFRASAPGEVTITVTAKDGSKLKSSMKVTIEQHVYAFDVQVPRNTGNYVAEDGEHWIAYAGTKNITLTPVVTYNEDSKEYPANKNYKNYELIFAENAKGILTADKKGTGIVVAKNTAVGTYAVTIKNTDSNLSKTVFIDVVAAKETYIKDVSIGLPKNATSAEEGKVMLAEGSKVKLDGKLNGGEKTKGYTLIWSVSGKEGNIGEAEVNKSGTLDLSKAKAKDVYNVTLTVSKGETSKSGSLEVTVTQKTDASALKLVLAENESQTLPANFNVQYENNGKIFKVANQVGAANNYSVTGSMKGVLTLEETEDGYRVSGEGTGSAKITIAALDGSNVKKSITIKVVSAENPVNKLTTGSKTYVVEPGMPIAIPYSVTARSGKVTDARVEWTSSNENILKVSSGIEEEAERSFITEATSGYLTIRAESGMTGKVTLTGKALDGSKKSVKVTINVVKKGKNEVTCGISLQSPAKTPVTGVSGLALLPYGKSVKLTASVYPSKAKNKTITYKVEGVDSDGKVLYNQEELKAMGVTLKKGTVSAGKKCSYNGIVKVTATLDYMMYIDGKATPIEGTKLLYVQPIVTKVEITDAEGIVLKTATCTAGESITLKARSEGIGVITWQTIGWSVNDSKLASVDSNGYVIIKENAKKGKKVKVTATALDGSKKKATVTIIIK